jgi:3-hydroxyacyl-[acyl-carrier-protein] dehydratase
MPFENIIESLPYKRPFLFVDNLIQLTDQGAIGEYLIRPDEYFFEGHFPGNPIVPGVIITEIMAQIGLVSLGIYLLGEKNETESVFPAFSNANIDFLHKVGPGDLLTVDSKKVYFRFGKLKCSISCRNQNGVLVASGECSGMIIKKSTSCHYRYRSSCSQWNWN